jgi:hypothetical protein
VGIGKEKRYVKGDEGTPTLEKEGFLVLPWWGTLFYKTKGF